MSVDYEDMSIADAKDLLRKWRDNNERRNDEVVEIWLNVLCDANRINKLGNEKHIILEQVIFSSLDCHFYSTAEACIFLLNQEFPRSMRVMWCKAALLEAQEKYDEAMEMLDNILKMDETHSGARKRRVTILKAQGLIPEAIKELVDYLKKLITDVEGWQELCSLYLQVQDYSKAAFCAEEIILHQPHNHLMHQRIADIRYTMGGVENMELAKSYYSQALKLNPDNMRALLGLFLVTNHLLTQYKSSGNSSKRNATLKLWEWAQKAVAQKQNEIQSTAPAPNTQLTKALKALAITE